MTINTQRVGALASAALLITILFNAEVSLANAEDQPSTLEAQQNAQTSAADDALPRFVATPVVQALPEIAVEESSLELADVSGQPKPNAESLRDLVGSIGIESDFSNEMTCLAQAVYFESRGEPLAGQLAVAKVVINRMQASSFPSSYCSVVTQRAQFSFVRNGRIPAPKTSSTAWKRARAIAQIADQGLWDSKADDALYFHAKSVNPRWARKKTARATIDSHIFYR